MSILTHAIAGAALSLKTASLDQSLILGTLSHFFFDIVPHNDYIYFYFLKRAEKSKSIYKTPISLLLSVTTLAIIGLIFYVSQDPKLLVGAFGGILPDLVTAASSRFSSKPTPFDKFHNFIQKRRSLAGLFLENFQHLKIKPSGTFEGSFNNYREIARTGWGRLGLTTELLIELAVLAFFLGSIYQTLP